MYSIVTCDKRMNVRSVLLQQRRHDHPPPPSPLDHLPGVQVLPGLQDAQGASGGLWKAGGERGAAGRGRPTGRSGRVQVAHSKIIHSYSRFGPSSNTKWLIFGHDIYGVDSGRTKEVCATINEELGVRAHSFSFCLGYRYTA